MLQDNLIRFFEDSMRMHWSQPAMSDFGHGKVFTYGEVAEQVEKIHLMLLQSGIQKGDKVSLIGRNSTHWVMSYVGVLTYGAVIVPILQDFKPADVMHIVNHSESKLLFADENLYEPLDLDSMPDVRAVFSLGNFEPLAVGKRPLTKDERKEEEKAAKKDDREPISDLPLMSIEQLSVATINDLFAKKFANGFHKDLVRYDFRDNSEVGSINYTSGTTGFSKGVVTPLNALAVQVVYGLRSNLVGEGCRFVCFLPLAHAFGCAFDFLANFCGGGYTCYFGRPLAVPLLLKAFAEVKPTTILTVPLVIEKIYKKMIQPILTDPTKSWIFAVPGLSSAVQMTIKNKLLNAFGGEVTELILGGAPLNAEVEAFFLKINFPFTVGYGMTECAPLISHAHPADFKPSSCGRILEGLMQVRIADPNAEGIGEIEVTGEDVMLGYYKNEEATKMTFSEDHWLKTGDLGKVDEDGTIYIKGRNKTMLLGPNGQNIYPEEIEAVLNNMPYVAESIVLQKDTSIVALVYPDYEAVDAGHLDTAALKAAMEENRKTVNSQIPAYEQVNQIRIYAHEFEKTPKKSIKRFLYNADMGE